MKKGTDKKEEKIVDTRQVWEWLRVKSAKQLANSNKRLKEAGFKWESKSIQEEAVIHLTGSHSGNIMLAINPEKKRVKFFWTRVFYLNEELAASRNEKYKEISRQDFEKRYELKEEEA